MAYLRDVFKHDLPVVLIFCLSLALASALNRTAAQLIEFRPLIVPPKELIHFSFGFKQVLSNTLWLRALQADDFCENDRDKAKFNPGMLLQDALAYKMDPSRCHLGWVYQMMDLITELNPDFKWVYKLGGVQLSISVDDREGARRIFEKGIAKYPDDWQLLYRAAYHYIFEVQNKDRAQEILTLAAQNKEAPSIIPLLASRLATLGGQGEMAISILEDYMANTPSDSDGHQQAKFRVEQLKSFLNSQKK